MRVPVYERRVGIAPLSMPQIQPQAPVSDNGAYAAKTLGGVFGKLKEIQDGMEDARTLEMFNKFKMDSQEYHENPDRGIYNTRLGYRSYGIYQEADEWLRHKGEDYVRELPSERAKSNFRRMAREHIEQRGLQNSRFEAEQVRKYEQEQADASIKNSINEVANHPYDEDAVGRARQDIIQALELKYRYSSPEERKAAMTAMQSDIASARLNVMLKDNPLKAEKWFAEHSEDFEPQTRLKFREAIKNETEIYKIQSTVDQLVKAFPQGTEREALQWIREHFSGDVEERIASAYKTRSNEIALDANAKDRLLRLQQDKFEDALEKNFYLNGTLPADEEFRYYVANGQLRVEQAERLQGKGDVYVNRSRIEKQVLASNPNLSQLELDAAVMRRMGTTQEEYNSVFAAAVQAVMTGQADNKILEYLYQRGKLAKHDVETINKNAGTLDEIQKNYYRAEYQDLNNTIKDLVNAGLPEELVQGIRDRFSSRAGIELNPRSKTYREDLLKLKKEVLIDAIDNSGLRLDGYLWGQTGLGDIRTGIQDQTLENRGIDPFPTLPDVSSSPINLASHAPSSGNPVMSMVQGGVVPKGGGFDAPRTYRKGVHNGLDIAAPAGTSIVMQDYGTPLTVAKVKTDTPSKGAGNYVVLSGTYPNGDKIEITLGHIQNDSINVQQGQIVNAGELIGKIGNTGMTSEHGKITAWYEGKKTGYHVDVKIKINGKYVDPAKFMPPVQIPNVQTQQMNLEDIFDFKEILPTYGSL